VFKQDKYSFLFAIRLLSVPNEEQLKQIEDLLRKDLILLFSCNFFFQKGVDKKLKIGII